MSYGNYKNMKCQYNDKMFTFRNFTTIRKEIIRVIKVNM